MVIIPRLSQPLAAVGKRITSWDDDGERLLVEAGSLVRRAACPRCLKKSSRLHGRYRRGVADSACFGRPVTLNVEVRRFKCVTRGCPQRTFSERIDPLAEIGTVIRIWPLTKRTCDPSWRTRLNRGDEGPSQCPCQRHRGEVF